MGFEHWLIDHDPASNYGNWCAIAGLGFGKAQYFNIHKQAGNYDRGGVFVKQWLPQLKGGGGKGYPRACTPLKGSVGGGGRSYSSGRNKSSGRGRNRNGQRSYARR